MFSDIFDLDDKTKEKEREIEVLKRALKFQDTSMKKHIRNAFNGTEATEIEKQVRLNDSLHR